MAFTKLFIMIELPKAIIISGTDRNVGKTTLACRLISHFRSDNPIGIKISPHRHLIENQDVVIIQNEDFIILEETKSTTSKDSSRMRAAGAERVFFIMAEDKFLTASMQILQDYIDLSERLIIESAALRRFYVPEQFILVYSKEYPESKTKNKDIDAFVNRRLIFDGVHFYENNQKIDLSK